MVLSKSSCIATTWVPVIFFENVHNKKKNLEVRFKWACKHHWCVPIIKLFTVLIVT
jgi:hypothetical protein